MFRTSYAEQDAEIYLMVVGSGSAVIPFLRFFRSIICLMGRTPLVFQWGGVGPTTLSCCCFLLICSHWQWVKRKHSKNAKSLLFTIVLVVAVVSPSPAALLRDVHFQASWQCRWHYGHV